MLPVQPRSPTRPQPAAATQAADSGGSSQRLRGYTAYLGGSFDPVHMGHVASGCALLMQDAQELWLAPTATHADKCGQTAYPLRLQQCQALAREIDGRLPQALRGRIRVSDVESRVASGGQTVRVFEHLQQAFPQRKFALAIGSDCLASAPSWDGWERLQQLARVYVLDRPGYPGRHPNLLADAMPNISSTEVRRAIAAGEAVDAWVPREVVRLIDRLGLYRAKSQGVGLREGSQRPGPAPEGHLPGRICTARPGPKDALRAPLSASFGHATPSPGGVADVRPAPLPQGQPGLAAAPARGTASTSAPLPSAASMASSPADAQKLAHVSDPSAK